MIFLRAFFFGEGGMGGHSTIYSKKQNFLMMSGDGNGKGEGRTNKNITLFVLNIQNLENMIYTQESLNKVGLELKLNQIIFEETGLRMMEVFCMDRPAEDYDETNRRLFEWKKMEKKKKVVTLTKWCMSCQKKEKFKNMKICSKCKMTWYCSTKCQSRDWKFHKKMCN